MEEKIVDMLENNGNSFIQHIQVVRTLMKYVSPIFPSYYYIKLTIKYDNVILGETDFRLEEKDLTKLFNSK